MEAICWKAIGERGEGPSTTYLTFSFSLVKMKSEKENERSERRESE